MEITFKAAIAAFFVLNGKQLFVKVAILSRKMALRLLLVARCGNAIAKYIASGVTPN